MGTRDWSRRDLLKSVGTAAVVGGVGAAIAERLGPYIVATTGDAGVTAAASVSETPHQRIDLTAHTGMTLVCGSYSPTGSQSLGAREDVAFVQPDRKLTYVDRGTASSPASDNPVQPAVDSETTLPWGIDRVDADVAQADGATGDGVDVAVIDSGIDPQHPDLVDRLADPSDESAHEAWVECRGDCQRPWADDGGHGTHVAGTIAADASERLVGVAPGARLHALKVCGAQGGCRTSAVVEAIRYAADQGWDVANLSLGSPRGSPALEAAGEYAREAGLVPVAAAGNRGPGSVGYPAAYDEYVAVSAATIDDEIANFSSTGPAVDLAAPGKGVCSTVPDGYAGQDGTSMAAPHVTGALAQVVASGATTTDPPDRLRETAERLAADDDAQGAGLVDVAAALGYDSGDDGTGDGVGCPT